MLVRPKIKLFDYGNVIPPLSLGYLATALEKAGHEVMILDQPSIDMSSAGFVQALLDYQPQYVGVSVLTPEFDNAVADTKLIRTTLPHCVIMWGGPHVSAVPDCIISLPVDVAIIGEGEETIIDVVSGNDFIKISGIAYKDHNDLVYTSKRAPPQELDLLGSPAYHLLPMDKYKYYQRGWEDRLFFNMMTSRGCCFGCTFCCSAVSGNKVRFRSIKHIVDEIEWLYEQYDVTAISFVDDLFTINLERIKEFHDEMVNRGLNKKIIWSCNARVDNMTDKMLMYMKHAGCMKISFGVESGDPIVLTKIKKHITVEQVKNAFKLARKEGIETLGFFMIGLPGETKDSIKQSIELAKQINPDFISVTVLTPLPGSPVWEENKDKLSTDWSRYKFTAFDEKPVLQLGEVTVDELPGELKHFYRSFYYRPRYVLSRLMKIRSIGDLVFYIKKALAVSKYWRG